MEQENCIQFACFMVKSKEKEFKDKRPMDHMAHLRNQFKSINTFEQIYDYQNIIMLIERIKKQLYPFREMNVPYL